MPSVHVTGPARLTGYYLLYCSFVMESVRTEMGTYACSRFLEGVMSYLPNEVHYMINYSRATAIAACCVPLSGTAPVSCTLHLLVCVPYNSPDVILTGVKATAKTNHTMDEYLSTVDTPAPPGDNSFTHGVVGRTLHNLSKSRTDSKGLPVTTQSQHECIRSANQTT